MVRSRDPILDAGTRLERYEVVRLMAIGGMAEIYLARSCGLEGVDKLVVLKRILPELAGDETFVRMFLDEARLASSLNHPNIAQVYEFGRSDRSHFIAMEYVHGEDLRAILSEAARSRRGIDLEHALAIVCGVAAGLHHAHERRGRDGELLGIVHRDVSPSNVLVSFDGAVKLVDFGIAKAAARQTRTQTGVIKGKAAYMSPEQCRGGPLDRRSDLFALGILLYELSSGRRLFSGTSDLEISRRICDGDIPSLTAVDATYPPQLEAIVLKALRIDPAERYATARELQQEIEEFALQSRLSLSGAKLASYLAELFGDRLELATTAVDRVPREPANKAVDRVSPAPARARGRVGVGAALGVLLGASVAVAGALLLWPGDPASSPGRVERLPVQAPPTPLRGGEDAGAAADGATTADVTADVEAGSTPAPAVDAKHGATTSGSASMRSRKRAGRAAPTRTGSEAGVIDSALPPLDSARPPR